MWSLVVVLLIANSTSGAAQSETPRKHSRIPYPAPLPEEILDGRIACDADGNLFVPIEVHSDRVLFRNSTSSIVTSIPLKKLSTPILSPRGN